MMKLDRVEVCTTIKDKQNSSARKEIYVEQKEEKQDYSSILAISFNTIMLIVLIFGIVLFS